MGQNQSLELTEEEKKELSTRLLREWWIVTTQALVGEIGSKEAMTYLRPYVINSANASAINIKLLTKLPTEDAGQIMGLWNGIVHAVLVQGRRKIKTSSEDLAFADITDCAIGKRCWEICQDVCVTGASRGSIELNPNFETEMIKSIWWGDEFCCFRTWKPGTDSSLPPLIEIPIPELSPELSTFLELAYMGESWVIATRAFIDALGTETTILRLRIEMIKSGQSIGERCIEKLTANENGIGHFIHLFNELHNKKESCTFNDNSVKCEVLECPFSSSPPEICLQYEAFFNGICEAIDPSFEFAYDRMMTKGDKTCHWTIRKNGEVAKEKAKEEPTSDEPIKRLTNKYIDGEISKEEYEEKMAIIKKHYPR
jgi:hypothetical protein